MSLHLLYQWAYSSKIKVFLWDVPSCPPYLFLSTLWWVSLITVPHQAGKDKEDEVEEEERGRDLVSRWKYQRRERGQELKRGYEEGMMSMGRRGKLHKSSLTVHQLNEPHTADKDDGRNNDDSGGANRVLFF